MNNRKILIVILTILCIMANAEDKLSSILNESNPNLRPSPVVKLHENNNVNIMAMNKQSNQFNNLATIDKDSNDINQLNRKLAVEKIEAEIRKLKNSSSESNHTLGNVSDEHAQTTVTGVAINAKGKKIAWLQFADGGSLTVNIGSKVGKYVVTDISMTGVTLSLENHKNSQQHTIFLKRVYAKNGINSGNSNSSTKNSFFFTPSPVITSANSKSDYVPPIIPLHSD